MGGNNNHPTTVETVYRIRTLCLTKNAHTIVSNSCPVESTPNDDVFLSVNLVEDLQPNLSADQEFEDDEILDFDVHSNEPRNYVAGYKQKVKHATK